MFLIPPEYDPQWVDETHLSIRVDGRRFDAAVEDGRLIVLSVYEDGEHIPAPRADFVLRASGQMALTGPGFFGVLPAAPQT